MLPWAHPSPQPKWCLYRFSRFCTAHGRVSSSMHGHDLSPKNCPFAWGNLEPHLTHGSFGPIECSTEMASRLVQPFLHSSPQRVPILYNVPPLLSSKLPLPVGDLDPHLTHGSLGPPESSTQTTSRSVELFLAMLTTVTD